MTHTYTCAQCRRTFESETTHEQAMAEYVETFGPAGAQEPYAEVCDDCYRMMCPGGKPISPS